MKNFLKILVGIGLVLIKVETGWGQLNNMAFIGDEPGREQHLPFLRNRFTVLRLESINRPKPDWTGSVFLSINSFVFFKDNEYFNDIIEGYTLFGTQLNPQLAYYPAKNLRMEAGAFLWKDFGNPILQQVRPTYRVTWTVGKNQFILGNTRPNLNHNYIEPLFNFERVMLKPLEEGLQYRHLGDRLFLDAWVDWQRQQYRYSNYQEEIAGGLSGILSLTKSERRIQVTVPMQFTATHDGGQIDTLNNPLQTLFNGAVGLQARMGLGNRIKALRLDAYALGFQDHSFTTGQFPFKNGTAFYLNGTLETRYADVMLNYFEGQHFISPLGGDLYQGLSRTVSDPTYTEPNRRVLLLRLMRDFRIADSAALTVRLEPVYDFNARLLDFSLGVYFNFRQEWLLGNVGQRVRVGQ